MIERFQKLVISVGEQLCSIVKPEGARHIPIPPDPVNHFRLAEHMRMLRHISLILAARRLGIPLAGVAEIFTTLSADEPRCEHRQAGQQ
ncbi:MAG TPA: hypothetical protein VFC19_29035 [Candidatus Limnocylindrales bacterium]|nr:hypothetical protein [Candidatus Limnocylindrales bacterium]